MRILHLSDHYLPVLGGIETHVAGLASRQAARGDEVSVLTSTPRSADGRRADDSGPVAVRRVSSTREGYGVDLTDVDVLHAHVSVVAPFSAPLAAHAARRGVPTVVTVHSLWNGLGPVPMVTAALQGLRSAPVHWTAVSRVAEDALRPALPRGTVVHLLPNAVDVAPRAATPGPRGDGTVQLVSTMRIARRKRPLALVDMFDALRRSVDQPVHLTVIGDGPLRPRLERRIRQLDLADQVVVTGRVEPVDVRTLLADADVYVAPATLESFGLAALEARCVGLPVVGRCATGMTEFVEHGVEGLLCASDADLVAGLRTLVDDPALLRRISEHNRVAPAAMTWANTLGRHDETYVRAMREQPRRAVRTAVDR